MQAHFCRTVVALGSPQSWDEPSGWGHCAGPPCPAVEWLLMLQSQESRDAQTLHPNGGSTENTTARQCCRQREGHFVAKVFFFSSWICFFFQVAFLCEALWTVWAEPSGRNLKGEASSRSQPDRRT